MRCLAVLCVRNEAAFLLDWIAHHQATGFTDFLVFSNDCEDGTDLMLDRLAALGLVTHIRNDGPYDKRGIQFTALNLAAKHVALKRADWVLPLDIDEFVNIHVGDRTLGALFAAVPEATAITLTWRVFGNGGVVRFADMPPTQQFTKAAPTITHWPWRLAMFKTLYRNNGIYRKPGVHRPRDPDTSRLAKAAWVDGNGHALPDRFRTKRIFSNFGRPMYGLAQLNHYPLGAMETYVLKAARGRAVHSSDMLGLDYWVERNFAVEEDLSIAELAARTQSHRATLAADPELNRLHDNAVAWRRAKFDALMAEEPFRALFGRLLMTPPSQPIKAATARQLQEYARSSAQN